MNLEVRLAIAVDIAEQIAIEAQFAPGLAEIAPADEIEMLHAVPCLVCKAFMAGLFS